MSNTNKRPNITTLHVPLDTRSYDIHIGAGLLNNIPHYLPSDFTQINNPQILIITDQSLANHGHLDMLETAFDHITNARLDSIILPSGESQKSFDNFTEICEQILACGITRQTYLIAFGGGVIGDLVGFVAASLLRGIPFIQIPTTLLAQVDSSVGGKTGINTSAGKNLVGAFYQPRAVIIDLDLLKTLPARQMRSGYAEIIKYGLINNAEFFAWCLKYGNNIINHDLDALIYAVAFSCQSKADIVRQDERESGMRALLNLGHTFAHAFEAESGYDGTLTHGEAVAIGMICAAHASHYILNAPLATYHDLRAHFKAIGMPYCLASYPQLHNAQSLIRHMYKDKKASKEQLNFILMDQVGAAKMVYNIKESDILPTLSSSITEK